MLNLSDKELDQLSRDASDHYDPDSLTGSGSWDKLEWRLDKELGRISRPNPFRGLRSIRRIPFYYAPVIVLLVGVGVSYYFIKHGKSGSAATPSTSPVAARSEPSGSPPMTVVQPIAPGSTKHDSSTKSLTNTYNSTSTTPGQDQGTGQPASAGIKTPDGNPSVVSTHPPSAGGNTTGNTAPAGTMTSPAPGTSAASTAASNPSTASAHPSPAGTTTPSDASTGSTTAVTPSTASGIPSTASTGSTSSKNLSTASASGTSGLTTSAGLHHHTTTSGITGTALSPSANRSPGTSGHRHGHPGNHPASLLPDQQADGAAGASTASGAPGQPDEGNASTAAGQSSHPGATNPSGSSSGNINSASKDAAAFQPRDAERSIVSAPHSLAGTPVVDDAGLRAITSKSNAIATPIKLNKNSGPSMNINRRLQFGFLIAPDFSSVNSLAGDKPGSSLGLTVDYQFLHRLYLSSGLLLTRKNYAALPDNYHVPNGYYQNNNIHDVSLIKGTFSMLEVPLNLRYDFAITGNTMFFASGGVTSYLFTTESSQYYYNLFGRLACQNFNNGPGSPTSGAGRNYLFASVDLSVGVETGISNSLSLLIAPYMKLPAAGIGFGQVQMSSVGVNFSLRYAPVLSRKKKH